MTLLQYKAAGLNAILQMKDVNKSKIFGIKFL